MRPVDSQTFGCWMQDNSFSVDLFAVVIALLLGGLFLAAWQWGRGFHVPHIKFSDPKDLSATRPTWREKYKNIPGQLMLGALVLFALAFIDPHYFVKKEAKESEEPPVKQVTIPTEGVAIYLVLDRSGSMSQEVNARNPQGRWVKMTKMALLKQVTRRFIEGDPGLNLPGRPNDMLGLVAFARGAQVLSPLTLDHQAILNQLEQINYATDPEEDGTAIGYAIYKTANLIEATRHFSEDLVGEGNKPAYEIKNTVMILVTDGFQAPSELDQGKRYRNIELVEAAEYARDNDITLYIINVEPRMISSEFALYRKLMKQIAELTGGKFYLVDSSMGLDRVYAEIDRLEKGQLPVETQYVTPPKSQLPHLYRRVSLYPYFIAAGMICLAAGAFLIGVVMRRVP